MKDNKGYLVLTYYTKGKNNNWYCDYYFYNGDRYERGTTRATGWGYDKASTCVSNAINKYSKNWKRYNKKAKKYTSYGLYDDNTISYGIGVNAVINCLKCFKNVKILDTYYGINENMLKLEIKGQDKIC